MHDDHDAADLIGNALPKNQPPPRFDLDQIVRDGYRVRRRNRIMASGSAALGVVAAVGAIALLVSFQPSGPPPVADEPTPEITEQDDEPVIEDTAMAGYPYDHQWQFLEDPVTNALVSSEEEITIGDAATELFAELLVASGLWSEPERSAEAASCDDLEDGEPLFDPDCENDSDRLAFDAEQRPGNYGQVFLRNYHAKVWGDDSIFDNPIANFDYYLPGGWTTEPGPVTEQLFPQHLISDGPYYTDQLPAFEERPLDEDGRQVVVADHGCAYEVIVFNANGSAFRVSWETGCPSGPADAYPVDLDALVDAVLAMPEFAFDTSALQPVGELWDVPTGWLTDRSWELGDGNAGAESAMSAVHTTLNTHFPGATVSTAWGTELGIPHRGSVHQRAYRYDGNLPFMTDTDWGEERLGYEFRYFLPGGWLPGISDENLLTPYLAYCRNEDGAVCRQFQQDGWIVTTEVEDREYEVSVAHPDGWGATMWIGFGESGTDLTLDEVVDFMLDLPAPPYDPEEVPEIPAR
jgi:hypothetical protein